MAHADKNIASCQVELIHRNNGLNRALQDTLAKFRDACQMIADITEERWPALFALEHFILIIAYEIAILVYSRLNPQAIVPVGPSDSILFQRFIFFAAYTAASLLFYFKCKKDAKTASAGF